MLLLIQAAIIACYIGMIAVGWTFVRKVKELIAIIRECKTTLEITAPSRVSVQPMKPGELENGIHDRNEQR